MLSARRVYQAGYSGGIPSPLQLSEIRAYAEMEGWDAPESAFRMFVDTMRKLDDAYLKLIAKRQKSDRDAEKARTSRPKLR